VKNAESERPVRVLTPGAVIALLLSVFFFWIWYERYLSIEFNELGRYYDAENHIVYTDAAFVWCLPAFGFLLLAIVILSYRLMLCRVNKGIA